LGAAAAMARSLNPALLRSQLDADPTKIAYALSVLPPAADRPYTPLKLLSTVLKMWVKQVHERWRERRRLCLHCCWLGKRATASHARVGHAADDSSLRLAPKRLTTSDAALPNVSHPRVLFAVSRTTTLVPVVSPSLAPRFPIASPWKAFGMGRLNSLLAGRPTSAKGARLEVCINLKCGRLDGNALGNAGAKALAAEVAKCPSLVILRHVSAACFRHWGTCHVKQVTDGGTPCQC